MIAAMKKMNETFTAQEIDQIIADADLDHDGEVNFHEFVIVMSNQQWQTL